jgi:hypothetical protein
MFRLRVTSDRQPRRKNGHAPHNTTNRPSRQQVAHGNEKDRHRESKAHPEAPRHIDQFAVFLLIL